MQDGCDDLPSALLNLISKLAPLLGDLEVNFPGRLISRGFGHGFGLFGLAKTFLGSRYHAGPPGNRAVSAGDGPGHYLGVSGE